MTNKEQTNLISIAKLRERVTKSQLEEVGAQLLVDLDRQLDSYYSFDSDETWKEAHRIADEACKEAQTKVKERNRQLGIPERFAPSLHCSWYDAGEQASDDLKKELRKVGKQQVDAMIKSAKCRIESASLEAQTKILTANFSSEAQTLLDAMPTATDLMPKLNLGDLEKLLGNGDSHNRRRLE